MIPRLAFHLAVWLGLLAWADVSAPRVSASSPVPSGAVASADPAIEELPEPEFELLLAPESILAEQWDAPPEFFLLGPGFEELPLPENAQGKLVTPPTPRKWEGRLEFGANGSEGNSDRFATRYSGKLKRTTPRSLWTLDVLHSSSYAKGVQNENKTLVDSRTEWPWRTTPWFAYTHGTSEYDEFTAYDLRLSTDSGFGYQYLDTGITNFKGRAGAGFSQEINSPDEHFTPEGIVGFSFEHKLSGRQKLVASGDVFHDLRDLEDFRSRSTASWEIKIDPPARLSLRLGIINRYDSTPSGKKRNDFDYSTVIVWEF